MKKRINTKKIIPKLIILFLIIIVAITGIYFKRYAPTDETVDIDSYLGISSEDDVAIVLDCSLQSAIGKYVDGHIYVSYDTVYNNINDRFFWDSIDKILIFTTAEGSASAGLDDEGYEYLGSQVTTDYDVVFEDNDTIYVALDFIKTYANITYTYYDEPKRAVITSKWTKVRQVRVTKDTQLRKLGGVKSPVVSLVSKGDTLTLIDEGEDWHHVATEDGYIGYVRTSCLSDSVEVTLSNEFEESDVEHNLYDDKLNILWVQTTNYSSNYLINNALEESKSVDVIIPTWFSLDSNEGDITSCADTAYVTKAHEKGVKVWGLVNNLENTDIDIDTLLTDTTTRQALENNLINEVIRCGLDGLNIDFESLNQTQAKAYLQFIREISIKCRNNNIVLSIDDYPPSDYTACYDFEEQAAFADYIIIMAYNEHYSGTDAGSTASLSYVSESIVNSLNLIPANQLVLGIPFYTRVWSQEGNDASTLTSTSVSMETAEQLIEQNNAEKVWDDELGQYFCEYSADGKNYMIWLEDELSIEEKLKVYSENDLAGAAFWKADQETDGVWDVIASYFQ